MNIAINDDKPICSIQKEFSSAFPYLKLEFFLKQQHGNEQAKRLIRHHDRKLGECRTLHNAGIITIMPEMTVADLEQQFVSVYGLDVQVFRQSGKVWLETTVTDSWTLEEQNRQGESLSRPVN